MNEYVTAMVGGQLFGLPIRRVQDVFIPDRLTRVPLAPPEIAGVLNLRGRIVTLIDMRLRLGLDRRDDGDAANGGRRRIARRILRPSDRQRRRSAQVRQRIAANATRSISIRAWRSVSSGIYRMDGQLLMVLDVDRVLDIAAAGAPESQHDTDDIETS